MARMSLPIPRSLSEKVRKLSAEAFVDLKKTAAIKGKVKKNKSFPYFTIAEVSSTRSSAVTFAEGLSEK